MLWPLSMGIFDKAAGLIKTGVVSSELTPSQDRTDVSACSCGQEWPPQQSAARKKRFTSISRSNSQRSRFRFIPSFQQMAIYILFCCRVYVLGGNKGALRVPLHSFQYLRRPGCAAKLLCYHIVGEFESHRLHHLTKELTSENR